MPQTTKAILEPTVQDAIRDLRNTLTPLYGHGETEAIIRLVFQHLKGWGTVDLLINENRVLSDYMRQKLSEIKERLERREPVQYISGLAYFYGMDFIVRPGVLVPRPETEELVDLIVSRNKKPDMRVLDMGTGTGCIAIALARNLPFSKITAVDNSTVAVETAQENAALFKADISVLQEDIFTWEPDPASFDIIVSNPPYVNLSESATMDANVLDYEPHDAIFVPDDDPLVYYRRIAEMAKKALAAGGRLYFEINPRHAESMIEMLSTLGFTEVKTYLDIHGKKRMLSCILPE